MFQSVPRQESEFRDAPFFAHTRILREPEMVSNPRCETHKNEQVVGPQPYEASAVDVVYVVLLEICFASESW